jgi:hypothetical protein
LNGSSQAVTANNDNLTSSILNNLSVRIGQRANSSNVFPLQGQLDDIRIYNRALSEPEIKLLASEPGIGYKPAKKLSRFSQRYTYEPPPATQYGVIRQTNRDHASLREGLVGAWCPSIAGSGLTLPDLSQRNNHGTLTNMGPEDWVSSQYGRALDFDGSNDYVSIANATVSGLSEVTASFFARPRSTTSRVELTQGADLTTRFGAALSEDGNAYIVPTSLSGFGYCNWSSLGVSNFIHVVCQYFAGGATAADRVRIYLNGARQTLLFAGTIPTTPISVGGVMFLGARPGPSTYSDGNADDIRIYSRILTEPEIRLLASRPGIGLIPERKSLLFQQQQFSPAWSRRQQLIGSGVY